MSGCGCGRVTQPTWTFADTTHPADLQARAARVRRRRGGPPGFVVVAPDGTRTPYPTEIQARAAQIRNRGGTIETD